MFDSKTYQATYRKNNRELRRKWNREWIAKNRDRYNAAKYKYRDRVKQEVLLHYGAGKVECASCGFTEIDALCLDHIDNNGAQHRKDIGIKGRNTTTGTRTYEALKKAGFPTGLQILCANCNMMKELRRKREIRLKNTFYVS